MNDFVGGNTRSLDDILKNDIRKLRDRCRDLSRNNEFVRRYINLMKTNVIGSHGIKLQVRSKDKDQNLDYVANNIIESRWRRWILKDNCDLSGRYGWLDMQNLLVQTLFTDGEVLVQFVENADNDFRFAINFLDCDLIDENRNGNNGKNDIRMGVEFDYRTKRPVAYYLYERNPYENFMQTSAVESKRVSAENLLHIYMPERANQSRGFSPIASVLKELKMLHAYAEAELVASRVNASAMGFITSPSGDQFTGEDTSSDGFSPMMNVEAGTIQQLPQGSDFKKFDTSHPTTAFDPFIKSILRQISAGLNISYNDLSNDFSKSFKNSDQVLLCPVYKAGEKIKLKFKYEKFAQDISKHSKVLEIMENQKQDLVNFFKNNLKGNEIVIGMGAGSISGWLKELKNFLK